MSDNNLLGLFVLGLFVYGLILGFGIGREFPKRNHRVDPSGYQFDPEQNRPKFLPGIHARNCEIKADGGFTVRTVRTDPTWPKDE